ncbi:hypothetical protein NCC49_001542 [Naganishia albida]|nr:hypothetical protein NCC49_001542 [Naganishia albida]
MFIVTALSNVINNIFNLRSAQPPAKPLVMAAALLVCSATAVSGASTTHSNPSYVPVAMLRRDLSLSFGKYTGWIGLDCGIVKEVDKLPTLPPSSPAFLASSPAASDAAVVHDFILSSDFVLLAGPLSDDHLEEEDRLERGRRILDHRQAVWRQARARQQADLEARQDRLRRDLAKSTSLQVYVPLIAASLWDCASKIAASLWDRASEIVVHGFEWLYRMLRGCQGLVRGSLRRLFSFHFALLEAKEEPKIPTHATKEEKAKAAKKRKARDTHKRNKR